MKIRPLFPFALLLAVGLLAGGENGAWAAEGTSRITEILEKHTAFRWGVDCLVWMVHYPGELVDPWVDSEASKKGLTGEEKKQFRESFVRDLRLSEAEPVLLTFYLFGGAPLSLSPLSDHLWLEKADGEKVKPLSYETKFDKAIEGVTQGLVYFPRQTGSFVLVLQGMGDDEARRFEFVAFQSRKDMPDKAAVQPKSNDEEIVVVLAAPEKRNKSEKAVEGKKKPKVTPSPTPSEDTMEEPPAYLVLPPKGPGMPGPSPEPTSEATPTPEPTMVLDLTPEPTRSSLPPLSKERTVERFLDGWVAGDIPSMHALLSEGSRTLLDEKALASRTKDSGFRWALKDGYKLDWVDEGTVRVSAAQKMLVMRVLRTELLRVVNEQGQWRIVW